MPSQGLVLIIIERFLAIAIPVLCKKLTVKILRFVFVSTWVMTKELYSPYFHPSRLKRPLLDPSEGGHLGTTSHGEIRGHRRRFARTGSYPKENHLRLEI